MPFTVTHALAILPVAYGWRQPGIMTALMVGAMVPDWPLYVPFGPSYETTHSLEGLLLACVPMGLLISIVFIRYMKRPLWELMPQGLRKRLCRYLQEPFAWQFRPVLGMLVALLIASSSHILWDAFTHGNAWGVAAYPELRQVWVTVAGVKFPGYLTLQHGSSLIGLPLMLILFGIWYWRAPLNNAPEMLLSDTGRVVWLLLIPGIPLVIMVRYLLLVEQEGLRPVIRALYYGVTEGGFAFLTLTAAYALVFFPFLRLRKRIQTV